MVPVWSGLVLDPAAMPRRPNRCLSRSAVARFSCSLRSCEGARLSDANGLAWLGLASPGLGDGLAGNCVKVG